MSLMKWDPFRDVQSLQHAVNRLFDDSIARHFERGYGIGFGVADIYETTDKIVVYADVPGLAQEDITVQMLGNQLIIQGERKQTMPENARQLRVERPCGTFHRSFSVGIPVKQDAIKATLRNGVLEVVLPKSDESKPRQIRIQLEE
ncbi:MAG: Hsp20/alpha crystallin family protein [Candidatus Desulforudis sp.]|nr:Hsp20/alpha crystallin family protein [Desulforudis sp.]